MDAKPAAIITVVLAIGLLATGLLATSTVEQPPAAIETSAPTEPTPAAPAPQQPSEPALEPTPTATPAPVEALPTLADALRSEYPGIAFFEGAWGDYAPAPDERVGQPGVYAGVVGITSGSKTVKFDGGTAVITPGRFDGFKNTTELVIEVR